MSEYFNPIYSTDNIWRGQNSEQCLTDDLDSIESDITTLQTGKANSNHTHTGYATTTDLEQLGILCLVRLRLVTLIAAVMHLLLVPFLVLTLQILLLNRVLLVIYTIRSGLAASLKHGIANL